MCLVPAFAAGSAPLAEVGWTSSSSALFDYRTNGSALPMYALFVVCLVVFLFGVARQLQGLRSDSTRPTGKTAGRSARLLRFGVFQRRISRRRYSGWTHLTIFWGVVVLGLGSLVILLDGYLLRALGLELPRGVGYKVFQSSLDLFGVAFVLGVGLAIYRRVWIKPEHKPADGRMLLVLFILFGIGVSGFVLEGIRIMVEGSTEPWAFAGNATAALIAKASPSAESAVLLYRLLWWGHVVAVFGLIAAVPYSPLRHVFTSPMNILVSPDRPSGAVTTPFNLKELMQSGRFDVKTGVDSTEDFTPHERLGIVACADSGNCHDVCPAGATGTPLSPMRLVQALRAAVTDGASAAGDSRQLPNDAISEDAIWSCTLCGACTGACPVLVDPMVYILQLRRGLVANGRQGKERTDVLANLTRARNPYGSSAAAREGLATALGVPSLREDRDVDMLYWVGCAATFDPRVRAVADATVRILGKAGIRCGVLGPEEVCCGDPARRIGEEGLFQELALENIEAIERRGVKTVLTHCAHCFNTLRKEYPELGARFDVVHHASLINELIETRAIEPANDLMESVTFHDSCYIGRLNGGVEHPRAALRSIPGLRLSEMSRSGDQAFCCGAGGANYWHEVPRREKIAAVRMREAEATGARLLVTECPFCLKMLEDARGKADDAATLSVRDIAEVVAESLGEVQER
jgi:Fe-S oxidoreductase/nitrate reductase gamma subunit